MIFGWSPGIGDHSYLGWLTVLGYLVASLLCFRAAHRDTGATNLWRIMGFALAVLGINKQLDLQTLLTDVGRELARSGGWYDQRRQIQRLFVVAVGLASVVLVAAAAALLKSQSRHIRAASAGFVLLAAFICIRAASFHHIDKFLKSTMLGVRFNWTLELGGIAVIAVAAATASRPRKAAILGSDESCLE